jgi:hypothetical protein
MNIIELAKQAEFTDREIQIAHDNFARFAELVATQEREECAKVCDGQVSELYASRDTVDCAEYLAGQIRARGTT